MKVAMFPLSGPSASVAGPSVAGAGPGPSAVPPEFLEMAESIFGDKNDMVGSSDGSGGEQKMEKGASLS